MLPHYVYVTIAYPPPGCGTRYKDKTLGFGLAIAPFLPCSRVHQLGRVPSVPYDCVRFTVASRRTIALLSSLILSR